MSQNWLPPHFHDTYSIGLVKEGYVRGCIYTTGGYQEFFGSPGDIIIVHPYEVSNSLTIKGSIQMLALYPSIDFIDDAVNERHSKDEYIHFDHPIISSSEVRNKEIQESLVKSYKGDNFRLSEELVSIVMNTFRKQSFNKKSIYEPSLTSSAIERACKYMGERYADPISIEDVSRHAGMSTFHFIRRFKSLMGLTPIAYLRQIRLARARVLLVNGMDIAGAACEAGFYDQAHMTHLFRKNLGFTPGQLTKMASQQGY